jgi:carbonic anhydrase
MKQILLSKRMTLGIYGVSLILTAMALNAGCSFAQNPTPQPPAAPAHAQAAAPNPHAAPAAPGMSPMKAWDRLIDGNARFADGRLEHPEQTVMRRTEVAKGQHPYAIVLTCSDSRVPPELVFDAGLGDIFVIRVAGNTADDAAVGSMEYAVEHLHVPLIVVLGHERCGAVQATVQAVQTNQRPGGHLGAILNPIVPAVETVKAQGGDMAENAMRENVLRTVNQLKAAKPVLAEAVQERKLSIVGARYDLDTGRVTLIDKAPIVSAMSSQKAGSH